MTFAHVYNAPILGHFTPPFLLKLPFWRPSLTKWIFWPLTA